MPIFVIAKDSGCEGFSPPVQAFTDEASARAAIALLSESDTWKLYSVPLWPEPVAQPWFNMKSI